MKSLTEYLIEQQGWSNHGSNFDLFDVANYISDYVDDINKFITDCNKRDKTSKTLFDVIELHVDDTNFIDDLKSEFGEDIVSLINQNDDEFIDEFTKLS